MSFVIPKVRPAAGNVGSPITPVYRKAPAPIKQQREKKRSTKKSQQVVDEKPSRPVDYTSELRRARYLILEGGYGIQAVPQLPRLPVDYHTAAYMHNVQYYVNKTGIERIYMGQIQTLISLPQLPYNPYPALIYSLRKYMEAQKVSAETDEQISFHFNYPVEPTRIDYLYKSRDADFIWGLSSVVRCCNAERMSLYKWLMKDLIPPLDTMLFHNIPEYKEYRVQPMVSLVGPAVFHDTFYTEIYSIDVRVEYLIVGPTVEPSFELFLKCLTRDLTFTENNTHHILLGVSIPVNPTAPPLKTVNRLWVVDEINSQADEFWNQAYLAISNKKAIVAEMIFKIDYFMTEYRRGRKHYSFNFLEQSNELKKTDSLYCYVEHPEGAMFEGVFFERTHAEAYLNMFTPRIELMDLDKLHKYELPPARVAHNNLLHKFVLPEADPNPPRALRPRPPGQVIAPIGNDEEDIEEFLKFGKGGDLNNPKVKIDGFKKNISMQYSPESWKIVTPVKSSWQRFIARNHLIADIFDSMPYLTQIVLLDRSSYSKNCLIEIYKLLRSKAYMLYVLIQQNRFIRELIENFEKAEESQIVQSQFKSYKKGLKNLLNSDINHVSSEMSTVGRVIEYRLDDMTNTTIGQGTNVRLVPKYVLNLRFINFLCLPVLWQMVEDVMNTCPHIRTMITEIKEAFPEEVVPVDELMTREDYFFGYEDERIYNQHRKVLEVERTVEHELVPPEVATESVILKYLLDTHVDEVWRIYLMDLFTRKHLPIDPYPLLVTELRKASLKMNMFFEPDGNILRRIYHTKPRLVDPTTFVYHIPGCQLYGFQSALNALDTAALFRVVPLLASLQNKEFTQYRQGYKAAISMAVIGNLPYYGRMDPYIRSIELVDHVYIKGPTSCSKEGSELFSQVVAEHISELNNRADSNFVIVGVFLGGAHTRWGMTDIQRKRRSFEVDIENCVEKKGAIYLKVLTVFDWRYIAVEKHFRYHYVSYDDTEYVEWFTENPAESYQSVFISQEQASFHAQRGGTHRCCDPFTSASVRECFTFLNGVIHEAHRQQDYLAVHRALLSKALIGSNDGHVSEAWRMFQSIASRLNFVNYLNKTLQDLVFYILEHRDFSTPNVPATIATKENEPVINRKGQILMPVQIPVDATDEIFGNLSLDVLNSTLNGYYHKINELLYDSSSLSSDSMPDVVRSQLNELIQRRPDGSVSLIIDPSTIRRLEDIRQETLSIEYALAYDLHSSCPQAVEALRTVEAEASIRRPVQYEYDHVITREDVVHHGQLIVADHTDQWHYLV